MITMRPHFLKTLALSAGMASFALVTASTALAIGRPGVNERCFAEMGVAVTKPSNLTLEQLKNLGSCRIAAQNALLDNAIARVAELEKVSDAVKAELQQELNAAKTTLAGIEQKLVADTDKAVALSDYRLISTSVRVGWLILPRARIVAAADRITIISARLEEVSARLAQLNAVLSDPVVKQENADLLKSLNTSIALAKGKALKARADVVILRPDLGDTAVRDANTATLQAALALLKNAKDKPALTGTSRSAKEDVANALKYIKTIRDNFPAKPNIIFVLVDDLDLDAMRQLPGLKKDMADTGMTFENHFVSLSLCCPSRATMLCGKYAHDTKVYGNKLPTGGYKAFKAAGNEAHTIGTLLKKAGYQTALMGKYLNGYGGYLDEDGGGGGVPPIPPGWSEWVVPYIGNAYNGYNYTLNVNGEPEEHYLPNCDKVHFGKCLADADKAPYADRVAQYITNVLEGKATDFIRRNAQAEKPFFLFLAPYAPHGPATPPPHHENSPVDDSFRPSQDPAFDQLVNNAPSWLTGISPLTPILKERMDKVYTKRIRSMYGVQDMVHNLIQTLADTGQLQNTYIVFTSDNGYHLGEHRFPGGKNTGFDTDIKVPLIIRGPGIAPGSVAENLTANVDFHPTFAELAGVAVPEDVDGRSLKPVLLGEDVPAWRQAVLLEHAGPEEETGSEDGSGIEEPPDDDFKGLEKGITGNIPPFVGLRTSKYTYIHYETGEEELYNNIADPHQLSNIAKTTDAQFLASFKAWSRDLSKCHGGATCRRVEENPVPPPGGNPSVSLVANPSSVVLGESVTLTWSAPNAASCTGTGFSAGGGTSGTLQVTPTRSSNPTYSVVCTGVNGSAIASVVVSVIPLVPGIDLTAGAVTPTAVSAGIPATLTAPLWNFGLQSTTGSFTALLQYATAYDPLSHTPEGVDPKVVTAPISTLIPSGENTLATFSYTFPPADGGSTRFVRVCADKKGPLDKGVITEAKEKNNCGAWTAVNVGNAVLSCTADFPQVTFTGPAFAPGTDIVLRPTSGAVTLGDHLYGIIDVITLRNGTLLLTTDDRSDLDVENGYYASSALPVYKSEDNGLTWKQFPPAVAFSPGTTRTLGNVRGLQLRDGSVLLAYRDHLFTFEGRKRLPEYRLRVTKSETIGHINQCLDTDVPAWSEPTTFTTNTDRKNGLWEPFFVQSADPAEIQIYYGREFLKTEVCPDNDDVATDKAQEILRQTSRDDGRTWSEPQTVLRKGISREGIPVVARLNDGTLVMAFETFPPNYVCERKSTYITVGLAMSTDDGRTWTYLPEAFEKVTGRPHLIRLHDGRLLIKYSVNQSNFMRIRVSKNIPSRNQPPVWGSPTDIFHGLVWGNVTQTAAGTIVVAGSVNTIHYPDAERLPSRTQTFTLTARDIPAPQAGAPASVWSSVVASASSAFQSVRTFLGL